ncbi:MAG: SHOCT domain-containing protein [Amaricoccus sp.]
MATLTEEGRRRAGEIAARHQVSSESAVALALALLAGGRTQAQFSIPELGGMGQWSQGGMVMVGDMFNNALKARVDALCTDLAALLADSKLVVADGRPGGGWWPAGLGVPASTGDQNGLRYAFFPAARRLAIEQDGRTRVYDTGEHRLSGFSQQQGPAGVLGFTSQLGPVALSDLPLIGTDGAAQAVGERRRPAEAPEPAGAARGSKDASSDVFAKLERLADLHARGILTATEFEAKKKELLARI